MNVKKVSLSAFFVLMLMVPTLLGAVPLTIQTPVGVVSTAVCEAEARNRNTNANRPRALTARNTGANRVESFSANRRTYTVNVRQSTSRADIRVGLRAGQQVRWRIDTRRANDTWNNGSYNSWRTRTTRNTNQDIRVSINQGQQRRLRVQIRDNSGNIRTITVNVRRASGNTWGANLRTTNGTLTPRFARATTNYTVQLGAGQTATDIFFERAHHNAQMRFRSRVQNDNGTWGAWTAWSQGDFRRANLRAETGYVNYHHPTQIQFQIRGAFTNMSGTPTRTRNYNVTVRRSAFTLHQQMARNYVDFFNGDGWGVSRQWLINILVLWEDLSQADAARAVDGAGINWNRQAEITAQRLTGLGFYTHQEIYEILRADGFTSAQANHGANFAV